MKEILQYLCTWKFWKELFIMTLGMAIAAAAVPSRPPPSITS